jgi:hypothetical protein
VTHNRIPKVPKYEGPFVRHVVTTGGHIEGDLALSSCSRGQSLKIHRPRIHFILDKFEDT